MIRDPSDGSVREKRRFEVSALPDDREQKERAARLQASREWLREYLDGRRLAQQTTQQEIGTHAEGQDGSG